MLQGVEEETWRSLLKGLACLSQEGGAVHCSRDLGRSQQWPAWSWPPASGWSSARGGGSPDFEALPCLLGQRERMANSRVKKARGPARHRTGGGWELGREGVGPEPGLSAGVGPPGGLAEHWLTLTAGGQHGPGPRGACCLSGSSLNTLASPAQSWLSLASVFLSLKV